MDNIEVTSKCLYNYVPFPCDGDMEYNQLYELFGAWEWTFDGFTGVDIMDVTKNIT